MTIQNFFVYETEVEKEVKRREVQEEKEKKREELKNKILHWSVALSLEAYVLSLSVGDYLHYGKNSLIYLIPLNILCIAVISRFN